MGLLSFGASQSAVGLDIGAERVRVAQISATASGRVLTAYGIAHTPFGALTDGEIIDGPAISAAIKDAWKSAGIRGKTCAVGVSNQRVVVRLIDLPFMERAELANAIQYLAQDYIPMAVEESIFDFQIMGDYMTSSDEHMMEVLLVAAHREMIDHTVSAVEGAGVKLSGIDVSSFAVARAVLDDTDAVLPADDGSATAIIHISSDLTSITIVERGVPRFNRISSLAGGTITHAIANALDIGFDEAEEIKRTIGLRDISGVEQEPFSGADPALVPVAQDAIEREANRFIAEVRRSIDYYLTQTAQTRTIQRILLSGSGSQLRNFPQYLQTALQTQVVTGDPLSRLKVAPSVQNAVLADKMGSSTAIGLALGGLQV